MPRHPGEILLEELMKVGLTQADFSRLTGIGAMRLSLVIRGARPQLRPKLRRLHRIFPHTYR